MTAPAPMRGTTPTPERDQLLELSGLTVAYETRHGDIPALDDVSLTLHRGEALGLVGESGCGKSSLALAVLGLLADNARVDAGRIQLEGEDLLGLSEARMRRHRSNDLAIVFQGAMNAWNPVYTVAQQIDEAMRAHRRDLTRRQSRARIGELFEQVGLAAEAMDRYPHQCSGGMRQRAAIAMALSCDPKVIVADEPTTALDVIVQDRILTVLKTIQVERNVGLIYISHDIAAVATVSDRLAVMHAGRIVEVGPTRKLLARPGDAHSSALLASIPSIRGPRPRPHPPAAVAHPRRDGDATAPLLAVEGLRKLYPLDGGRFRRATRFVHAVDGLDLSIARGEALGLVGESGCGKTTTARILTRLTCATEGRVLLRGPARPGDDPSVDVADIDRSGIRDFRRRVQMIFQDPYESINPRRTVLDTVTEPLRVQSLGTSAACDAAAVEMLDRVGLHPPRAYAYRFPHELSGGQRQRVAIARALVVGPDLVVADEPTSMLDANVRSSIMDLMLRLGHDLGVSYLFITHDLSVARYMCERIAVMYLGKIVEIAPTEQLLADPKHPYTRALLAAVPEPDPTVSRPEMDIRGGVADPVDPAPTCRFLQRCPWADGVCAANDHPPLERFGGDHHVACYHAG